MLTKTENVTPPQNLGLLDRLLRTFIGVAMLAGGIGYFLYLGEQSLTEGVMQIASGVEIGTIVMILLSIYPLLTAILGVDPFYRAAGIRSCGDSGRNQCGTFPFEVEAAVGKAPKFSDSRHERSLSSTHDEHKEQPHHAIWKVDQEPMLYPDDKTVEEFAERERNQEMENKKEVA